MIPYRLIEAKRDGAELSPEDVRAFFGDYLDDEVSEYQMAAFLMAVYFRGLSRNELDALVQTMVRSGEVLDLDHLPGPRVDKHSTGGVGDKVSLVLAPLAAELGMFVPMMSGRGLGHTGGTLDKLEAIPGFRTDLGLDEFRGVLEELGCAMIGQTEEIAPLDRRLYDLRSVTGTVPAIPLIATSIMSKKLAEGLNGLVLDVKAGSGAFITDFDRTLELARTMVRIGEDAGVATRALITAMDRPLGRTAGNALETREALECLAGEGPGDLREVVVALTGEMLVAASMEEDAGEARDRARTCLEGGAPLERFARLVERQGGDPRVVADPAILPRASVVSEVRSPKRGWLAALDPRLLGYGVVELGGGRTRLGQDIDLSVGFELRASPGDRMEEGDLVGRVHARSEEDARRGREILLDAMELSESEVEPGRPLVSHRVTEAGVEGLT